MSNFCWLGGYSWMQKLYQRDKETSNGWYSIQIVHIIYTYQLIYWWWLHVCRKSSFLSLESKKKRTTNKKISLDWAALFQWHIKNPFESRIPISYLVNNRLICSIFRPLFHIPPTRSVSRHFSVLPIICVLNVGNSNVGCILYVYYMRCVTNRQAYFPFDSR